MKLRISDHVEYYNAQEWRSTFTLGRNTAKNINYIEKYLKQKLCRIKFSTKDFLDTYLYLPLEWS